VAIFPGQIDSGDVSQRSLEALTNITKNGAINRGCWIAGRINLHNNGHSNPVGRVNCSRRNGYDNNNIAGQGGTPRGGTSRGRSGNSSG